MGSVIPKQQRFDNRIILVFESNPCCSMGIKLYPIDQEAMIRLSPDQQNAINDIYMQLQQFQNRLYSGCGIVALGFLLWIPLFTCVPKQAKQFEIDFQTFLNEINLKYRYLNMIILRRWKTIQTGRSRIEFNWLEIGLNDQEAMIMYNEERADAQKDCCLCCKYEKFISTFLDNIPNIFKVQKYQQLIQNFTYDKAKVPEGGYEYLLNKVGQHQNVELQPMGGQQYQQVPNQDQVI